jgi:acylphosphatase
MEVSRVVRVPFEVFGKVQGVFFRKFTERQAKALVLNGFVMNTPQGTVVGEVEGPMTRVTEMKRWLTSVGSPKCRIDRTDFGEEVVVRDGDIKYTKFEVRR